MDEPAPASLAVPRAAPCDGRPCGWSSERAASGLSLLCSSDSRSKACCFTTQAVACGLSRPEGRLSPGPMPPARVTRAPSFPLPPPESVLGAVRVVAPLDGHVEPGIAVEEPDRCAPSTSAPPRSSSRPPPRRSGAAPPDQRERLAVDRVARLESEDRGLVRLLQHDVDEAGRAGQASPAPEDATRRLDLLGGQRVERVTRSRCGCNRLHGQPLPAHFPPAPPPGAPYGVTICSLREPVNRARQFPLQARTARRTRRRTADRLILAAPGLGDGGARAKAEAQSGGPDDRLDRDRGGPAPVHHQSRRLQRPGPPAGGGAGDSPARTSRTIGPLAGRRRTFDPDVRVDQGSQSKNPARSCHGRPNRHWLA